MEQYKPGMLVENAGAPQWGPGKIVHIAGDNLFVFFRDLEGNTAKKLKSNSPALRIAVSQSDPILDNLPPFVNSKAGEWGLSVKRLSLQAVRRKFLHHFPMGFADAKYCSEERDYKLHGHKVFQELLGLDEIKRLVEQDKISILASKASAVLSKVNLLNAPFETGAFHDALQVQEAARSFFSALVTLLEADPVNGKAFGSYASAVCSLPAARGRVATWPIATILPYLARPDLHMFLKPEVTKHAAESLGFDLKYDATPNWKTYEALLRMGRTYLDILRPHGAVDFVDVQSFVFVACGGYDNESAKGPELILKVFAEGEELKLMRERDATGCRHFWTESHGSAIDDEEDAVPSEDPRIPRQKVDSAEAAFILLDAHPWHRFHPASIHPDFVSSVLREVKRKGGATEEKRWKEILHRR